MKTETREFINQYVLPSFDYSDSKELKIKDIISYIEENFEKPLSIKIASGDVIDYDFFLLVNSVISDLSCCC